MPYLKSLYLSSLSHTLAHRKVKYPCTQKLMKSIILVKVHFSCSVTQADKSNIKGEG